MCFLLILRPQTAKTNMAANVQFLYPSASSKEARRHLVNACFNPCDLIGFERTMRDSVKNLLLKPITDQKKLNPQEKPLGPGLD